MPPKRKTKTLFVSHCSHLGGAEVVLARFLEKATEFESAVLVPSGELADMLGKAGVKTVCSKHLGKLHKSENRLWPLRFLRQWIRSQTEILGTIRDLKPDMVQCNSFYAVIYCIVPAILAGKPLVWHMHDFTGGSLAHRAIARIYGRFADAIISVSDAVRRDLIKAGCPAGKIETIYNSLSIDQMGTVEKEVGRRIDEFARTRDLTVGLLGTVEPRKGFLEAVQALKAARETSDVDVGFVIAGEPKDAEHFKYEKKLKNFILENGLKKDVLFLGRISDIKSFFEKIDVFLHYPSKPDPLPTVILEAVASGCPVIASDNGGNPECAGYGRWGTITAAGSPEETGRVLASGEFVSPSGRDREAFAEFFSHEKKEKEHLKLYDNLMKNRRHRKPPCRR